MKQFLISIALLAALLTVSSASPREPAAASGRASPSAGSQYTITDLGTLGGPITKGMGINENGQVAGASQSGSYLYGFVWDGNTMTNLGDLGGQGSWAYDVNDSGRVVGGSPLGSGVNHAFQWQTGSGMQDLGTLGGPNSYAFEINNSGQAVGYACCAPDTYLSHAVLWGSGGIVDLGDLDPMWPTISAAYGINDAGQVVGGSYDEFANFHAFLWQNGGMQDLGTLGGDYSAAEAINESGQVVGTARLANSTPHAFLWQNGSMQDLGALTWDQSIAYDINDKGQVVGALQTGPNSHAFIWANGQMQDLNNLIPSDSGWVLQEARAINNNGKIAGFGTLNGQTRAYLLTLTATFRSTAANDGWVLESAETSNKGGAFNSAAATFNLGDDAADRQYRAILSFDTSDLPDDAVITQVTLKLKKKGVTGTDPFTSLGKLMVDVQAPNFGGAVGLAAEDFQAAAGKKKIGNIPNAPISKWYSRVWSTDTFFSFINRTGTTQFRLRFAKDDNDNNRADYLRFFSGNAAEANQPQLIIEYHVP